MKNSFTKIAEYDEKGIYLSEEIGEAQFRKRILRVASKEARNKKWVCDICVWPRQHGGTAEKEQIEHSISSICKELNWPIDTLKSILFSKIYELVNREINF